MHVHTKGDLSFLTNGRPPSVSGRRKYQREEVEEYVAPDTSNFPSIRAMDKTSARSGSSSARSTNCSPDKDAMPTKKFSQLRDGIGIVSELDRAVGIHDANKSLKKRRIQKDWEDLYMAPLSDAIHAQMFGERYASYKKQRSRAVTALDSRKGGHLDDEEYVPPPTLRIVTRRRADKVHVYRENAAKEERLTQFLADNGAAVAVTPRRVLKEIPANTMRRDMACVQKKRRFPEKTVSVVGNTLRNF